MKRVGFILKVKQELIDEYKLRHEDVWPEMLDALSRNGWSNYSLFMRDNGMLFGYFETRTAFKRLSMECRKKRSTNAGRPRWPSSSKEPEVRQTR